MLHQLQLDSLQTRRLRVRATMMYRVVNNRIQLSSTILQPAHKIIRGHSTAGDSSNHHVASDVTMTPFIQLGFQNGTKVYYS